MRDNADFENKLEDFRKGLLGQLRPHTDLKGAPIIPGYLAVPASQLPTALEALASEEPEAVSVDDLERDFLGVRHSADTLQRKLLEEILKSVQYIRLNSVDNGHLFDLISTLRFGVSCVDARPLFQMFPFNHWSAQPGEDGHEMTLDALIPKRARKPGVEDLDPAANTGWPVWVIDGSYNPDNPWHGLIDHRVIAEPYQTDGDHGTFVTGLIAVTSPNSCIRVLHTDFKDVRTTPPQGPPKLNEISVSARLAEAVFRYTEQRAPAPAVINLSLGTYDIRIERRGEPGRVDKLVPLTLEYQLEMTEGLRQLRIVAAGGNDRGHPDDEPPGTASLVAYPASDRRVIGVGAGSSRALEGELVWHLWTGKEGDRKRSPETVEPWYPRLDDLAPGLNILGPGGGDKVICWSGSSFAAALYSGHLAGYGTPPPCRNKSAYPVIAFDPLGI